MDSMLFLGVDIGGTNIRFGLIDEECQLTHYIKQESLDLKGEGSADNLISMISGYLKDTDSGEAVAAIGIGIPGQVSKDHSFVYSCPMLPGLQGIPLGQMIEEALGIPTFISHDVEPMLLYDIGTLGLDPTHDKTILGCYIGTGFGNALYLEGKIFSGAHGVAGELGHIPLYGVEDKCSCGATGCVETRACGRYLAELTAEYFPDCFIGDVFTRHGDDPRIVKFVKDCALPVATEITILDPDIVVLGGGVIYTQDFPKDVFEAEVLSRTRHPLPADDVRLVYTVDAQTNGVIGGGLAAIDLLSERNRNKC